LPSWSPTHRLSAGGSKSNFQREEIPIRTLSVSLLAVAAIAASVLLTRSRDEKAGDIPAGEQQPAEHSLDAIRAAGL